MSKPFDMVLSELDFLEELLRQDAETAKGLGDGDEVQVREAWADFVAEVSELLSEQRNRLNDLEPAND